MNIVDLRNRTDGAELLHMDYVDRNLVKVEPAEAILDLRYYVRVLETAIKPKSV